MMEPIIMESLANQLEDLGSEIGPMSSGVKNQVTTVLGDKMTSLPEHVRVPSQPLITRFKMKTGGTERQYCYPLTIMFGDVTEDLANGI